MIKHEIQIIKIIKRLFKNIITMYAILYTFFAWSLLHQGLPIGHKLQYLGVANPICAFCGQHWLHIIVHVEKVNVEVQHLWNLLDYWENAPCSISRVPSK